MERRKFIQNAAAVSSVTFMSPHLAFGSQANSAIRLGVIGCGNRGTAVASAFVKNTNTRIVAIADLFRNALQEAENNFNTVNTEKGFNAIEKIKIYAGPDAYMDLIQDRDVDAVLVSSPAYTHPEYAGAAVRQGKHVYCEKPVATDITGCRKFSQVGKDAEGKVSLVVGFQIRYAEPYIEMIRRINRGDIGELVNVQLYYFGRDKAYIEPLTDSFDEMRILNHYHYRALSGGILLDQGIHMIDVCNWQMQKKPLLAIGSGNAKGSLNIGDTYTNYQIIYEYPNDVNVCFHSKKMGSHGGDVCARFIGTTGTAEAHYSRGVFIKGANEWNGVLPSGTEPTEAQRAAGIFTSALANSTENKVKAFIDSINNGNYLNEAESATTSTLIAIMGANAAMSKEVITWDEMLYSRDILDPRLDLKQFAR